ncbi:hypothetical protein [Haloplanus sp.]|uniref:hypothetical protein n=1 Tax=Haloplanus sp. TaxID=1961696 RepID=UPI00263284D2|nr:hypothetical protein [Haloplanus sp.]
MRVTTGVSDGPRASATFRLVPTTASLPAVAFGVVEMAAGGGLTPWFSRLD